MHEYNLLNLTFRVYECKYVLMYTTAGEMSGVVSTPILKSFYINSRAHCGIVQGTVFSQSRNKISQTVSICDISPRTSEIF